MYISGDDADYSIFLDLKDDDENDDEMSDDCCCCCCYRDYRLSWPACLRNTFGCSLVLLSISFAMIYLILPFVLTSFMNAASIHFNSVSMSDTAPNNLPNILSFPTVHHLNHSLNIVASARLEQVHLPVDVGIITTALNVYHEGQQIGTLRPEQEEITLKASLGGDFTLPATLHITNFSSFHSFSSHLLNSPNVSWVLSTSPANPSSIRLRLPFFNISFFDVYIPGVQFHKKILLQGCNGLKNTSLEIFTLDDLPNPLYNSSNSTGLNVHIQAKVYNPSVANVSNMGIVRFNMYYDSKSVDLEEEVAQKKNTFATRRTTTNYFSPTTLEPTRHTVHNNGGHNDGGHNYAVRNGVTRYSLGHLLTDGELSVAPGWNILRASGRFIASGQYANELIEHFINGEQTKLIAISPDTNSASTDPLFSKFVGGLSIETTLNGYGKGLITEGVMLLTADVIAQLLNPFRGNKPIDVPTTIQILNPFGAILTITSVHFQVLANDTSRKDGTFDTEVVIGTANHDQLSIEVPRYGR